MGVAWGSGKAGGRRTQDGAARAQLTAEASVEEIHSRGGGLTLGTLHISPRVQVIMQEWGVSIQLVESLGVLSENESSATSLASLDCSSSLDDKPFGARAWPPSAQDGNLQIGSARVNESISQRIGA